MSVASTLTTLYPSMLHYHCYHHCTSVSQHSHSDVSCQYSHHTVHINVTLPYVIIITVHHCPNTVTVMSVASTLTTLYTLMLHYQCYRHCTSLSQHSHSDVSCQYSHHTVHINVTLPLLSSLYITVPTQSLLSVASTLTTLYTLLLHYHCYHHCTSLSQHSHSGVSCQYSHHTVHINVTLPLLSSLYITVPKQSQCCQLPVLSPHCTH